MSTSRWKDISAVYAMALECPAADRESLLAAVCAGDDDLRQEVESLLACHVDAQKALTRPAARILADAIVTDTPALIGRQLGAYRIDAPLGAGGMGEVYRATDIRLHREVALKILPQHLRGDTQLRARFRREAEAVAALRHPHICVLHDIGEADGVDYLVMELLDGETLADRLVRGPVPPGESLRYALHIADALVATHRQGIVHRDLKPGNVMLTASGAKLLDFGIAKLQRAPGGSTSGAFAEVASCTPVPGPMTAAAGTLPYMTPEQLDGRDADHWSDLFAFGVLLYEMLTGRLPFDATDPSRVVAAIREREPDPLPAPLEASVPGVGRVIETCLRKDPRERPDAAALAHALRQLVKADGVEARQSPRRDAVIGLLIVLLLASLGPSSGAHSVRRVAPLQNTHADGDRPPGGIRPAADMDVAALRERARHARERGDLVAAADALAEAKALVADDSALDEDLAELLRAAQEIVRRLHDVRGGSRDGAPVEALADAERLVQHGRRIEAIRALLAVQVPLEPTRTESSPQTGEAIEPMSTASSDPSDVSPRPGGPPMAAMDGDPSHAVAGSRESTAMPELLAVLRAYYRALASGDVDGARRFGADVDLSVPRNVERIEIGAIREVMIEPDAATVIADVEHVVGTSALTLLSVEHQLRNTADQWIVVAIQRR